MEQRGEERCLSTWYRILVIQRTHPWECVCVGSKEEVSFLVMGSKVGEKKRGEGIPLSKKMTKRVLERIQKRQWP